MSAEITTESGQGASHSSYRARMCGPDNLIQQRDKNMSMPKLIEQAMKSIVTPATGVEIYRAVYKAGGLNNLPEREGRKAINKALSDMKRKQGTVMSIFDDGAGVTFWDLTQERVVAKPKIKTPAPTKIAEPIAPIANKPAMIEVIAELLLAIGQACITASEKLK